MNFALPDHCQGKTFKETFARSIQKIFWIIKYLFSTTVNYQLSDSSLWKQSQFLLNPRKYIVLFILYSKALLRPYQPKGDYQCCCKNCSYTTQKSAGYPSSFILSVNANAATPRSQQRPSQKNAGRFGKQNQKAINYIKQPERSFMVFTIIAINQEDSQKQHVCHLIWIVKCSHIPVRIPVLIINTSCS